MKTICAIILIIFTCSLFAQNTWIMTYAPIPEAIDYRPVNLLKFNDDFIFNYNGHIFDYDPEWPEDWYEAGIIKIDSEGYIIWQYDTYYENINCIVITETGDIIASSSSYYSYYLFKINAEGEILWTYNLEEFQVWSFDNTIDGHIIMSGEINGQPAVRKITNEGIEIWTQIYDINQNSEGRLYAITATENGEYLSSGMINQNTTMKDALIIKIDENGEMLFFRTLDGYSSIDKAYSIAENNDGDIFTVGFCENNGYYHHLFWMLDSSGETLWMENSEGGFNRSVHYNADDNSFLVAGSNLFKVEQFNYEILTPNYNPCGYDKSIIILEDNLIFFHQDIWFYITVCKSDLNGVVNVNEDNIITSVSNKLSNFPNPFNPSTTIEFAIQNGSEIDLSIYNIKGQKIKTLTQKELIAGNHSIMWNGDDKSNKSVSSGIYFYKLIVNNKTEAVKKCLLLK